MLCCLEGKGATEAAEQLGWKLGTLSGRLTRAKDAVLAKLDARGLTLGVAAAVGLAAPPAAVAAKAAALVQVGFAVPSSILQLSQGVIGMGMKSVKVLAATVLLACGLGLGVGSGWVATADAGGAAARPKADPDADVKRLTAELERARALAEAAAKQAQDAQNDAVRERAQALERMKRSELLLKEAAEKYPLSGKTAPEDTYTFKTAKSEYALIQVSDITQTKFRELVNRYEGKGWEYAGTSPMVDPKVLVWIFRRPVKGTATGAIRDYLPYSVVKPPATAEVKPVNPVPPVPVVEAVKSANAIRKTLTEDAKSLEAEIARLTAKLADLKKAGAAPQVVVFDRASSPLDPAVLATVLAELGDKKFGKGGKHNVSHVNGITSVYGDKDVIDWATALVKSLGGK